jgi:hypothetical protein
MPMMSRNPQIINVLPHCRKQIAAEAGKGRFFETLTARVLICRLARRQSLCCRPDPRRSLPGSRATCLFSSAGAKALPHTHSGHS